MLVLPFTVSVTCGMFGAMAIGTLWAIWPLGTLMLGVLLLATRGRKRLIPAPPEPGTGPIPAPSPARRGGSVPQTGPDPGPGR
ncbi:MAG: hypothetical protein EON47_04165 [Acetobacteraceae bacterium]|nr:MAG: hypothetical protein EON47_04165 [Acetobacteraceae bacterium]